MAPLPPTMRVNVSNRQMASKKEKTYTLKIAIIMAEMDSKELKALFICSVHLKQFTWEGNLKLRYGCLTLHLEHSGSMCGHHGHQLTIQVLNLRFFYRAVSLVKE